MSSAAGHARDQPLVVTEDSADNSRMSRAARDASEKAQDTRVTDR